MSDPHTSDGDSPDINVLTQVEEFIGEQLAEVEQILAAELECWHPSVSDILEHVTRFRGKRLRPILLLMTGEASGGITGDHKVLAAVVEMIHIATLIHDDVLDEADTRRHVATVNARWNNETSVLFGDYLFTHAFHLASSLDTTFACRMIGRATNKVCVGELSQIHERGNWDLAEQTYLKIIDGKTAELCGLCCHLGAHFAGADDATSLRLADYGRALGMAFQIADDLLDILGSEKKMGKSLGSDLRKQKLTLPLIRLLSRSDGDAGQTIRELLANPDGATRQHIAPFLETSDAIEYTCRKAQQFASEAQRNLSCLPDSPVRRILAEMTDFAVQRSI